MSDIGASSSRQEPTSPRSFVSKNAQSSGASDGVSYKNRNHHGGEPSPNVENQTIKPNRPNVLIRAFRSVFGYRKTTLTFFVFLTFIATVIISKIDNSLDYSVSMPENELESNILQDSWLSLQKIAKLKHTYASEGNDYVHDYLEKEIKSLIENKQYIEYDNDLNYTNNVAFKTKYLNYDSVDYYESNNLLVRINGSNEELPAYLVSAHFDSVPSSYGVTDDGFGVASLLGLLNYYSSPLVDQPSRTIILNFNNDEEFGLYGATAFLYHPWFKQIKYFLNLEGTGAGGKAVLFRGTDNGIVKFFKNVRYPHATSLYQQGFNNGLIRSETDYKVYKEKGLIRGLDLAFYKPRDLYHTAGDSIQNVNIKSMWHMLSNAIDFTKTITSQKLDIDDEYLNYDNTENQYNHEFSIYASFLNWFFSAPVSKLLTMNIVFLIIVPIVSIPLFFISFYRKNWDINFVNIIKFPVSFGSSVFLLNGITNGIVVKVNEFLPNSSPGLLVSTLFSTFLILNYLILNGFNWLFKSYKGVNHDEKLIVIIETSIFYWAILIWSTIKLSNNKIGDDHTGEFPVLLLFLVESLASFFGLLGWSIQKSKSKFKKHLEIEDARPLLGSLDRQSNYGSNDDHFDDLDGDFDQTSNLSLSSSLLSNDPRHNKNHLFHGISKYFSYDWSIQFLLVAPLSSIIIYNTGFLLLDGLIKSIQESSKVQGYIFDIIKGFAILWALPFLPFIFKFNKIFIIAISWLVILGFVQIALTSPFDQANPLKLRFIETVDLNHKPIRNIVKVSARDIPLVRDVLNDLPSLKELNTTVDVESLNDGMALYSYNTEMDPKLAEDIDSLSSYIQVDIIKNSSSSHDYPFGLLTGEFKLNVPKNRNCKLDFNLSNTVSELYKDEYYFKDTPVKTVIVYADKTNDNSTDDEAYSQGIPDGFSIDKDGNYVFKDLDGIDLFQLNKLDWDKPYHVGFQWVPHIIDISEADKNKFNERAKFNKLGVNVQCFWGDDGFITDEKTVKEKIPAYSEVLHYSPNYISWANGGRGLVAIEKYFEI